MAEPSRHLPARGFSALGFGVLTTVLVATRGSLQLESILLLYVLLIVAVSLVAGIWAAQVCAVAALFTTNYFFVPPLHTLRIASRDDVVTLAVFVLVAGLVSLAAELAARQRAKAAALAVETRLLAGAAASPAAKSDPHQLIAAIRDSFGYTSVRLERHGEVLSEAGDVGAAGSRTVDLGGGFRLVVSGDERIGEDQNRLMRLGTAAVRAVESRELADVDRARSALLAAAGHDLRTPIAGISAAAAGLRARDLDPADHDALVDAVALSADRLRALVDNLLDASRLRAGVLAARCEPIGLEEVVHRVLAAAPTTITVDDLESLPLVLADPGMLERVLANLVDNASRHATGSSPELRSQVDDDRVRLALVDHGPGLDTSDPDRVFAPFQHRDDASASGMGLGLWVSRGFMEAMGGELVATDTPGGGLTMTLSLRRAP